MNKKADISTFVAMNLYRRTLKATIHPWFVKLLKKIAKLIDEKINTEIELCK
ncbi:MAG: hypothetical protein ACOCV1_04575 [Bacillota bacterium]